MNKSAFYKLSYGVYVVSCLDGERATGCTANSAMQITSDPATIAISMNHDNYTNKCIAESGKFALSIIGEHTDPSVIGTFGFQSGRDHDKFAAVAHRFQSGMPVIEDACAYFVCEVIDTLETTTHTIFLGKVMDADVLQKDDPMTYAYYHQVIKGKSPKNAPTYIAEEETAAPKAAQYVCGICGYVYDGAEDFESLPEDYRCPICKQPKSVFVKR
jgi:flavin reductase (DIM6/NTAB) family NADH-FMN oxidoreductase RutF/rubredoxin